MTERSRPPTGPSVGCGSASVETRPGTYGVPETVTKGRSLPTSSSPRAARAAPSSATACAPVRRPGPGRPGDVSLPEETEAL